MKYVEIKSEAIDVLSSAGGRFMSAYQVCQHFEKDYPDLWKKLVEAYPSTSTNKPMGEGAGRYYSPATFVATALANFVRNASVPGLQQEHLSCEGVQFSGIAPGYTGNVIGIWAVKST